MYPQFYSQCSMQGMHLECIYLPLSHYVKILNEDKDDCLLRCNILWSLPTPQVEEATTSIHTAASQKTLMLSVTVWRT